MKVNFLIRNKLLIISVLASILNLGMLINIAEAKPNPRNRKPKANKVKVTNIKIPENKFSILHSNSSRSAKKINHNHRLKQQYNSKQSKNNLNIPLKKSSLIANSFAGQASWYGPQFHGRPTASGEIYNQNALTAAHPELEFGTQVKVTNVNNGRSVVVKINDRGPFVSDRIIDLSAAAARSLGMISSGVAPVRITILGQ